MSMSIFKKIHHRIFNLPQNEQGGVLIFVGIAIFVLVASVGVAIDMGRIMIVRSRAMSALDAGILGAAATADAGADANKIKEMAKEYFDANYSNSFLDSSVSEIDTTVDTANGTVDGSVDIKVPTYFGSFLNIKNVDIGLNTQVKRVAGDKNLEIALALDVTPSMCFNNVGDYSKAACMASKGKLKALRDSVDVMVTTIEDSIASSGSKSETYYSFVPFLHTVKLNGVDNGNYHYTSKLTHKHIYETLNHLPTLRGLHRDGKQIVTDLDGVIANMKDFGGTNTAIGTYWGWLSLRKSSVAKFIGSSSHEDAASHPAAINDKDTYKILVIMTDGANTFLEFDEYENKWWEEHDILADLDQTALCGQIHKEGIEVFTIAFDVPKDKDGTNIRKILRDDCAMEDTKPGHYFEPTTPDELKNAFTNIASYLIDLRITK
jgi:Flp pilus assembly protein TadG